MISGRAIFKKLNILIILFCFLFSVMPRPFKNFFWSLMTVFSGSFPLLVRYAYLKSLANIAGLNVYVGRFVVLKAIEKISFGNNISIHDSCYIDATGYIYIGNNVSIAHQSSLITFNHTWTDVAKPIKYNSIELNKIVIEDDVWIGCGVRVMPGVRIGKRSVVAAGAVVTSDVAPGTVVAGVPARLIKKII